MYVEVDRRKICGLAKVVNSLTHLALGITGACVSIASPEHVQGIEPEMNRSEAFGTAFAQGVIRAAKPDEVLVVLSPHVTANRIGAKINEPFDRAHNKFFGNRE